MYKNILKNTKNKLLKNILIITFSLVFIICIFFISKKYESTAAIIKNSSNTENSIDKKTQEFLFGEWEIEKLIGYGSVQNDYSNYPDGHNVIGNKLIIEQNFLSTKDIDKYPRYQVEIDNPSYSLSSIPLYILDYYPEDSSKLEGIGSQLLLSIKSNGTSCVTFSLFITDENKLILGLDTAHYLLKKVQ